jgi:hypothetical protein
MDFYIILAISFAIMFTFRYTKEIAFTVQAVAKVHELQENKLISIVIYPILFIIAALMMPVYAFIILNSSRSDLIHSWSKQILINHYGLEEK